MSYSVLQFKYSTHFGNSVGILLLPSTIRHNSLLVVKYLNLEQLKLTESQPLTVSLQ